MFGRLSLSASLLAAVSCGSPSESQSELLRAEIPGSIVNHLSLGQAYDSDRAAWANIACVTGEADQAIINPSSTISYSRDLSYDKVMKLISGELGAGVKFPSIGVEAKAFYATENSTTNYRETHSLSFKYTVKNKLKLGSVVPSAKGQSYIAKNDPVLMRDRCKNEFVNEIDTGLVFLANMNVEFSSAADKQKYGGGLSVSVLQGTVTVKGNLAVADEKEKRKIKISLRAMQDGGDASKLAGILTPEVAACDAANLAPCIQGFQKLIAYGNSLPQQIDARGSNLKVLSYHTESYSDSGIDELVPAGEMAVPQSTIAARSRLESLLRDARRDYSRISQRLDASENLGREAEAIMRQVQDDIAANRERLTNALEFCYKEPYAADPADSQAKDCAKVALESERALYVIDPFVFEITGEVKIVPAYTDDVFVCEAALKHLERRGGVPKANAEVYRKNGSFPRFKDPSNWDSDQVGNWPNCAAAARELRLGYRPSPGAKPVPVSSASRTIGL